MFKNIDKFIITILINHIATKNVIGNWWNHKLLQAESQISPISGSIKEQVSYFCCKRIKLNFMEKVMM